MADNELVDTVSSQVGEFQTVGNMLATSTELQVAFAVLVIGRTDFNNCPISKVNGVVRPVQKSCSIRQKTSKILIKWRILAMKKSLT